MTAAASSASAPGQSARILRFKSARAKRREIQSAQYAKRLAATLIHRLSAQGYVTFDSQINILAEGGGMDRRTARRILAGIPSRKTTVDMMERLAERLGVFVGWLYDAQCPIRTDAELDALGPLSRLRKENPLAFAGIIKRLRAGDMGLVTAGESAQRALDLFGIKAGAEVTP